MLLNLPICIYVNNLDRFFFYCVPSPPPIKYIFLCPSLKSELGLLPLSFPSIRWPLRSGGFIIRPNLGQKPTIMGEQLVLKGTLKGHNGWVTQIATNPTNPDTILSSSRGNIQLLYR